jgi:hypothetical protein
MAATIDARVKKILIELAANDELEPREKLEAIRYLIEIKARKPNPKAKSKKAVSSPLG